MTDVRATLGLSPVDPDVLKRFGPPTYTEEQVLAYAAATRDGGEAVHTGQLRDEPVSSSGSTRDEAALPEAVGEAGAMPGSNGGFTMAAFKASDVPEGTKLYAAPPPPPVAETPANVVRLVKAAREAYRAIDPKDISDLPLVNELGAAVAAFDDCVPWEIPASRAPTDTGEGR